VPAVGRTESAGRRRAVVLVIGFLGPAGRDGCRVWIIAPGLATP
jgi:hypothetical protein